ncbi:3-hydroxyacyl-CoA dehydrogenase [Roseospira goensis]|uniref:3-hydroxybutyryl-CoA dehydrogenase n=1 Tax=Roseospira goensis TaxID=391922 RepID=A0A7W6RYR5_9PROT|nr:3-hydroxyacyl-CoA dehydrogenase [Roseospira goensis]MBB4285190.1 3-hydroxybutyryl-CoA dehydrogenase [Roseospira goensis]
MTASLADPARPVAIVGAGTMGRGIAQIAAAAGTPVLLYDVAPEVVSAARAFVAARFASAATKGRMTPADAEAATDRLHAAPSLEALAPAAVVIEAAAERLEVKTALFTDLEGILADDAILATNTSSLSVTAIAAGCRRPERVAGLHFFNPVPLMTVVEVIRGSRTAPAVTDALARLAEAWGHTAVHVLDTPGFLVNHAGRGLYTEGLRVVQEGVADPVTVDRILRDCAGFRMGPFELLDLTGIDVSFPVMEQIYRQFFDEPRFRPTPLAAQQVAAGLYGRKTGQGFYRYHDGTRETPAEPSAPPLRQVPLWVSPAVPRFAAPLRATLAGADVPLDDGDVPGPDSVCLVTPVGTDATAEAVRQGVPAARTVAVDMAFATPARLTMMTTPATTAAARDAAHAALAASGAAVSVIADSPGFVAQRVVATIVNIACDIAQQGIAAPGDIDRAVRLGLGYPRGPLEMGDDLGPATVLAILEAIRALTGDPRYRPSPWLRRRAALGLALTAPAVAD